MKIKSKFAIGDVVQDMITQFKGTVMAITLHATGCIHYAVQCDALNDKGMINDWEHLDESRLYKTKEEPMNFPANMAKPSVNGGPSQNPPKQTC